jgi:hypothetical protein
VEQHITDASAGRWVFKATVNKSPGKVFVRYGDADPSNVSFLVHGAEMRVADTRAVNRAMRKPTASAYVPSKRLDLSAKNSNPLRKRRNCQPNLATGTVASVQPATASASSFASISSIPAWSKRMRQIPARMKRCARKYCVATAGVANLWCNLDPRGASQSVSKSSGPKSR